MRRPCNIICAVLFALLAATAVSADVKMKVKRSMKIPGMDQMPQFENAQEQRRPNKDGIHDLHQGRPAAH